MIQTNQSSGECNEPFNGDNWSDTVNWQRECSPIYTHLAGLKASQLDPENLQPSGQNQSNVTQLGSQKGEEPESEIKSQKEKELEDCSNPKFKEESADDSHYETAITSELLAKHENSDTCTGNDESWKLATPASTDLKIEDNQPDVPMSLEDENMDEPVKHHEDKLNENKEGEVLDNQTIDSVRSHKKNSQEILKRLRFIASDHRLNKNSKTKNLNFFSTSKRIVDKFKSQIFKEVVAVEKYTDPFNQGESDIGLAKSQLQRWGTNSKRINQISHKSKEIRREKSTFELREPFLLDQQISIESKSKKELLELRAGKSQQNSQELAMQGETLEQNLQSIEPKDISSKIQKAFESYLLQVSLIYFEMQSEQPRPSLNELSTLISNNQNALSMDSSGGMAIIESRQPEYRSAVRSNNFQYSTLDVLCNPLRTPHVFENWSPREIAIFETWIWKFGKNFHQFPRFIKTKSTGEVIDFYFCWKNTSHYKTWHRKMGTFISEDHNDWVFK